MRYNPRCAQPLMMYTINERARKKPTMTPTMNSTILPMRCFTCIALFVVGLKHPTHVTKGHVDTTPAMKLDVILKHHHVLIINVKPEQTELVIDDGREVQVDLHVSIH